MLAITAQHKKTRAAASPPPRSLLWGRDAELDELLRWYERAHNQRHSLVAVQAPSGGGKSHLLDAFERQLTGGDGVVLRLQGRAQVGQQPLESLEPLVEMLQAHPVLRAQVCEEMASCQESLCASHPAFLDMFALESCPVGAHRRVDEVWAQMLNVLGKRGAPLVLIVDDAQWLDPLSASVLRRWRQELPMEGCAVMVVLGMRPEGLQRLPGLHREDFHSWMELQPLSREACAQCYATALGVMPTPIIAQRLYDSCEGNGFLLVTLLRGLEEMAREQGRLLEGPEPQQALAWLSVERQTQHQLLRSLEGLGEEVQEVLAFGSLLGRRFQARHAFELAGVPRRAGVRSLEEVQRRHILVLEEERAQFSHDKFREAILGSLRPERRRQMHKEVAELLRDQQGEDIFELAYHFHQAGDKQQAYEFAMKAAQRARHQEAWDLLVSNLEIALEGVDPEDHQRRWPILREMGQGCTFLGRYREALQWLDAGQPQTPEGIAQRDSLRAELYFRHNDSAAARAAATRALGQLGVRVPRGAAVLLVLIAGHLLWRLGQHLKQRWLYPEKTQMPQALALASSIHFRFVQSCGMMTDYPTLIWGLLHSLNRVAWFHPNRASVKLRSNTVVMTTLMGLKGVSTAAAARLVRDAQSCKDIEAQGIAHTVSVLAHASAGEVSQAYQCACQGVWFMERIEDYWEMNLSLYGRGLVELRLGRFLDAMRTGLRLFQRALESDEQHIMGGAITLMHLGSQRQLPSAHPALHHLDGVETDDEHFKGVILRNLLLEALRTHRWEEAHAFSLQAQGCARKSRLLYLSDCMDLHAEASRRFWEVCDPEARGERKRRRKVWRSALRDLERWARTFPLHAPAARRERALWCGHHNNERGALEAIERSLSLARDASMCGEEAFSLRVRAWLAERFGWAGISADRRQAQALMEQLAPTAQQVQQVRALVWGEGEGYSSEQEPSRQNLSRPPQSSAVAQAGA